MDRYTDHPTAAAVDASSREQIRLPLAALGPVLQVAFPLAATRRDIPHGMGVVPDGFFTYLASEGTLVATDVELWTADVAWLVASADNTIARLQFFTLEKGAIRHVVPTP